MNINATLIKHKRENNAWSQQQLAEISGVSLRTVQRLESTGRGSLDSVKAIASAFELAPADVIQGNKEANFLSPLGKVIGAFIASCLIAGVAGLYIVFGVNQIITLEVSIDAGPSKELVNILEDELGAEMKVKYDEYSYFVFTPNTADDGKLSISIAAFSTKKESSPEKIGDQMLVVEQHRNTTTIFETHAGKSYTFEIKASIGEPN